MAASSFRSDNLTAENAQISGNFTSSGTSFDSNNLFLQKNIERGYFVIDRDNTTQNPYWIPLEDSELEQTTAAYRNFLIAPFDMTIDRLLIRRTSNGGAESPSVRKLSELGALKINVHSSPANYDPFELKNNSVKRFYKDFDVSSIGDYGLLDISFENMDYQLLNDGGGYTTSTSERIDLSKGDVFSLSITPVGTTNWGDESFTNDLYLSYALISSLKINS